MMKRIFYPRLALFILLVSAVYTLPAQEVLTLEQVKQMALEKNNQLKIAQQRIYAANAAKEQALTAGKPAVDGSVTGFYIGKPLNQLLPEYGVSPAISVTQPLYAGGKIKLSRQIAVKSVEITEAQKEFTTTEVIFNTEKAYWNIVAMQEKVKLAEQFKKQLQALHTDLNHQFMAGLIYKNDLLRVEVQLNEAELNIVKAGDGVTIAKLVLAQLTGMNDNTGFVITDTVPGTFHSIPANAATDEVYRMRPEINILQKSIEAGQLQEQLLQAGFKPAIGVSAGGFAALGKQGINLSDPSRNSTASYYGMVSVSIPILDWGNRRQKVKQQQFNIAAQQYELQETKEQLNLEIRQAYIQLNQAAKQVALSNASLQQANENLRLSDDRFKAGTIVGKDVLEAQSIWQQAVTGTIDARVVYKIKEAALRKALGTTK